MACSRAPRQGHGQVRWWVTSWARSRQTRAYAARRRAEGKSAARRPANRYGWLWCVIGLGVGLDAFARGYATFGLLGRPGALPGAMVAAWATNFTWILGLGLLPLALLLSPDGRLPTRRRAPPAWLVLLLAVALPLEGAVSPGSL